jgi:hypothetical protein
MWWLAIAGVLVPAYLELGWVGVAAGVVGLALPIVFVVVFALRHGETEIER